MKRLMWAFALLVACSPAGTRSAALSPSPPVPASLPASPPPTALPSPLPLSNALIQRLSPQVGFVAGSTGDRVRLAKTTDGGVSWQPIAIPGRITALRFINESVGWAAAFERRDAPQVGCQQAAPTPAQPCRGVVLRTDDGGQSWRETLTIPIVGYEGEPILQLQAVDGNLAWILALAPTSCTSSGCSTELLRTVDGGRTWTTLASGNLVAVRFASANRGWLAAAIQNGTEISVTSDGGATWTSTFRSQSGGAVGLDAATVDTAWLLTRDGAYCTSSSCDRYELFRTNDGGVTWSSLGNPKKSLVSCGFGHLYGPLFASRTRGWLALNLGAGGVNAPGGLLSTEDGGQTWTCRTAPANTYMVSAADPDHVWVTSQDRGIPGTTLYSTEDGGRSWRAIDLTSIQ